MENLNDTKQDKKKNQIIFSAAERFKKEAKKNIITAVMAAFGFLIALVWRDAIKESVNDIIKLFSIEGSGAIILYITATLTTIICVIGIIIFSRWSEKKD